MRFLFAFLSFFTLCAAQIQAQTTWNSATTDWGTAANWSAGVPTATSTVVFNGSGTTTVDLGGVARDLLNLQFDTASVLAYTVQNGTLNFANTGTLSMASTVANAQIISASLSLGTGFTLSNNSAQLLTITGDINGNSNNWVTNGSGDVTLTGNVNLATVTYGGTGTLTLSGVSDNVGLGLTVNSGIILLSKTSNPGVHAIGGPGLIITGGTVRFTGPGDDQIWNGAGSFFRGGTVDLHGRNETGAFFRSDNNTGGANSAVITNSVNGTTSILTIDSNTVNGLGAKIEDGAGIVGIRRLGKGLFMLGNNTNSYSGKTLADSGQNITDTTGYGDLGGAGLENPSIFGISSQNALGTAPASYVADHLTLSGYVLFNIAQMSDDGYGFVGSGSSLVIGATRGITLGANGGEFRTGWGQPITIDSTISGTGALVKSDGGTLNLNAANTYSGDTQFRNTYGTGTIKLGHRLALQNSTLNTNNGTMDLTSLGGLTIVFGGLAGNTSPGTITIPSAATLQVGNNNSSTSFSGIINGGSGTILEKIGTGTLTVSGANAYGNTRITAGTLRTGAANTLPTGTNVTIGAGTLSTGATTGFSQAGLGALQATSSTSTIALGTGLHALNFSAFDNTGFVGLTINGWTGTTGGGGAGDQGRLFFTDTSGFTPIVLANITFTGFGTGAILNGTELVPVPEPLGLLTLGALGLAGWRRFRKGAC
ncbi:MAG: beta strand repeat-containing protein [Fimbriiglobus sp.]